MRLVEEAVRGRLNSAAPLVELLDGTGRITRSVTYRETTRAAQALAERLAATGGRPRTVGVVCGNTAEFVVADLALLAARVTEVPVPLAFSRTQAESLLGEVDVCLVDGPGRRRLAEWGRERVLPPGCEVDPIGLEELLADGAGPLRVPHSGEDWICKVIHTSGTTSRPKGVRIRARGLDALLGSLREAMPDGAFRRYLSVVPFSLLIEQVTGLYMVLLDGGSVTLLPTGMPLVGTAPSAASDVLPFLAKARPTALVATPALVDELATAATAARQANRPLAPTLFGTERVPLICCGGAPVHPDVLRLLADRGIPVYEGYGLSENSSVVSWNRPGACRIGTVGTPLPHVRVRVSEEGELLVRSPSLFAGYTRDDPSSCVVDGGWLHTGDLAEIDGAGFIRITGRKKNVIITSGGRNVAPEWLEAQYATLPFVRAVAVVGNDLPALHGLFLTEPGTDLDDARAAITAFGEANLSEIERVGVAHVVHTDEELYRRFFTVTGRPVRSAVETAIKAGTVTVPNTASTREADMTAAVELRPYGAGTGKMVIAAAGQALHDLDPRRIAGALAEAGFLVFRGFRPDLESFSQFVKALSARVTLDPARSFHGGDVAQKVDAGTAAVGLHVENGNSPFAPDLTWFFCERAAKAGSQTTVCDGYRVWDATSASTRDQFATRDIMYSRRVEESKWKTFVFHQLGGAKPVEEVTVEDIRAHTNDPESTTIQLNEDGSITYSYRTPAAHGTLFGSRLAWANSIFGPSYNYEAPRITFADGAEISVELWEEMRALTDELTEDIEWQDGDVALIDNTRVMHGRRAIEDVNRTIYNAQSYLRPELV